MPLDIQPVAATALNDSRGNPHPADVATTLHGLRGAYYSTDLYARYRSVAEEAGRQAAAINRFGRALTAAGCRRAKNPAGNRRGWIIA